MAESLSGQPPTIKVLELPGAKDLTEWVEHGGKRDELVELILKTPEWKRPSQGGGGFVLTPLAELLARPDIPVEYVVDGLLVAGTASVVAAKPKVGKSTFERNLSLSVSRGDDFLGFKTKAGEVIYLALEEREEDVRKDFQAMGANGSEPIFVHIAAAPAEGIVKLCELIRQRRPVLAVADPLFRLAHIRDEKAYAEVYAALGPLIDIAREAGTHVSLPHHAGKGLKADPIDSPLGSTALGGVASTLIFLKRSESRRTIQTVQRIGQDLAETILEFDPESRTLSLGVEKAQADAHAVEKEILEYLQSVDGPKTEDVIIDAVEGKTGLKRKALRRLVDEKKVAREGAGRKGDPFKYGFSFPRSPYTPGTRERESEKPPQTPINADDILVPVEHDTKTEIPFGGNENFGGSGQAVAEPEDHPVVDSEGDEAEPKNPPAPDLDRAGAQAQMAFALGSNGWNSETLVAAPGNHLVRCPGCRETWSTDSELSSHLLTCQLFDIGAMRWTELRLAQGHTVAQELVDRYQRYIALDVGPLARAIVNRPESRPGGDAEDEDDSPWEEVV